MIRGPAATNGSDSKEMTAPNPPEPFLAEIERHKKILFKVAYLYCANEADRQDLIQDILIQLWQSFGRFDGRSRFSTWMYRVALNVAISWRRGQSRRLQNSVPLTEAALQNRLMDERPEETPMEMRLLLGQLLERLGEFDRALILLYLEGHDHDAIGDILGITNTNVATRMSRIKQRLRREFAVPLTPGDKDEHR